MRFRKPGLRVKLVNFDFSAKLSSTGSEKSLDELGVPQNERFTFFTLLKSLLFTLSHG